MYLALCWVFFYMLSSWNLLISYCCCSVIKLCLTLCNLQHTRLPSPSLSPGVCSNLCPLSQWCHPFNSSSVAPFLPWIISSIRVFSNESALCIRWQKYWSFTFSISPSNEYSGLISFRIDSLVWSPCSPKDSQESSPAPQFESISSSTLSLLYGPTLTSIHDYWKNHSFY